MRHLYLLLCIAIFTFPIFAQENEVSIENSRYRVSFQAGQHTITILDKIHHLTFVTKGTFFTQISSYDFLSINGDKWGSGKSLVLQCKSDQVYAIQIYQQLPFVVISSSIKNTTEKPIELNRLPFLHMELDIGIDADHARALGTVGLTGVDHESNPGSYSFLTIADPETRSGIVGAWLTHERGSGVLFSDVENDRPIMKARLDYGHLRIPAQSEAQLEKFVLGYFEDARLGLEAYADLVADYYAIDLPPQPTVYCTWYHAGASDETKIIENAKFAKKHLAPYGFDVIQIDDKWQAGENLEGPRKNFTTHREDGPYPSGMEQTADRIKDLDLTPGIWFMPFAGTWNDPFFADKQHFFATKNGEPFVVRWGGTCFDMTHPETREYVRSVVDRIANDWGYEYFKLDGLWTGMATKINYINKGYKEDNLGEAKLHDPNITHIEAYRSGLQLINETAGDDVFLLGCNVAQNMRTLGASFGLLDAMRVGPDNGRNWDSMKRGPFSGSNLYFLHNRIWYNDPDPIYVRDSVPLEHARALTSWVAVTGQLNASSTQYEELSPERLRLLQRSIPSHDLKPRPVDFFEERIPRIWLLTDEKQSERRDVIGLFNWEEGEVATINESFERIDLSESKYHIFDYWNNRFLEPMENELMLTVPAASCRILSLKPQRDYPQVISTSRHITQGIVDLKEERWNHDQHVLSGISKVVENDPYELRIVSGDAGNHWKAVSVLLSEEGQETEIQITSQEENHLRVMIESPETKDIEWQIHFEK